MEIFSALLAICAGNPPVSGEFPNQRPVTRSLNIFLDLRPNKRLSIQWWGWWFETPSRPLWRHYNVINKNNADYIIRNIWYRCTERGEESVWFIVLLSLWWLFVPDHLGVQEIHHAKSPPRCVLVSNAIAEHSQDRSETTSVLCQLKMKQRMLYPIPLGGDLRRSHRAPWGAM